MIIAEYQSGCHWSVYADIQIDKETPRCVVLLSERERVCVCVREKEEELLRPAPPPKPQKPTLHTIFQLINQIIHIGLP